MAVAFYKSARAPKITCPWPRGGTAAARARAYFNVGLARSLQFEGSFERRALADTTIPNVEVVHPLWKRDGLTPTSFLPRRLNLHCNFERIVRSDF